MAILYPKKKITFLLLILVLNSITSYSQEPLISNERNQEFVKDSINKKRLYWTLGAGAVGLGGTSFILYNNWYRNFPRSRFHLKNDGQNWLQMDKIGHVYWAYSQTTLAAKGFMWMGIREKEAMIYGALSALLFQGAIEVMDGHSTNWGFSFYDLGANLIGTSMFIVQGRLLNDQVVKMKYSYSAENYSQYTSSEVNREIINSRVNTIYGTGFSTRFLKDYNGQTYWLSLGLESLMNEKSWLPDWLNLALGYGATNLLGARDNNWQESSRLVSDSLLKNQRTRQFYLSLDMDLSKIETDSSFLRSLLDALNILKIPFSALEINTNGEIKFHLIQF